MSKTENIRIVEAEEKYCQSHCETISSVAREGLYLSNNTGFSYDSTLSFFRICKQMGFPQFYVIDQNDRAVGWCDIVSRQETGAHVGYLGVGLLPEYREMGIGTKLIETALCAAAQFGFKEIRLECRASNKRAIHVYKSKFGFRTTAYKRKGMKIDGEYIPLVYMKKRIKKSADKFSADR